MHHVHNWDPVIIGGVIVGFVLLIAAIVFMSSMGKPPE